MKYSSSIWPTFCALVMLLPGCAAGGMSAGTTHLSAAQCRDLAALRANAPANHARNLSEMAALEEAGYDPGWLVDPNYPADLEAAQHQVDYWYETECPEAKPG